ncbi:MAG: hypothetical protein ACO3JL_15800, partial [Myxococcota bacterium]
MVPLAGSSAVTEDTSDGDETTPAPAVDRLSLSPEEVGFVAPTTRVEEDFIVAGVPIGPLEKREVYLRASENYSAREV